MDANRVLQINPELADGYKLRGAAHQELGQFAEAERDWSKAVELAPADIESRCSLAALHYVRGNLDSAVEECQKAIELDPASVRALFTLGSVHFVRGEFSEAVSKYSEVIRLGEKSDDPMVASAYYARGKAYQQKADADIGAAIKRGLGPNGQWPRNGESE